MNVLYRIDSAHTLLPGVSVRLSLARRRTNRDPSEALVGVIRTSFYDMENHDSELKSSIRLRFCD